MLPLLKSVVQFLRGTEKGGREGISHHIQLSVGFAPNDFGNFLSLTRVTWALLDR